MICWQFAAFDHGLDSIAALARYFIVGKFGHNFIHTNLAIHNRAILIQSALQVRFQRINSKFSI